MGIFLCFDGYEYNFKRVHALHFVLVFSAPLTYYRHLSRSVTTDVLILTSDYIWQKLNVFKISLLV